MTAPPTGIPIPQIAVPDQAPPPQLSSTAPHPSPFDVDALTKELLVKQAADAAAIAAARKAQQVELDRYLSGPDDFPLPKLQIPSPAAMPPRKAGGGVLSIMTPREDEEQLRKPQTATMQDNAREPGFWGRPIDTWQQWLLFYGAAALILGGIWWLAHLERNQYIRLWRVLMQTIRHRSALVICLGAALIFADWRIFDQLQADYYWRGAHKAGWIAFFGACTMLIGIYHWITGPPTE